eukprot:s8034_g2.t1
MRRRQPTIQHVTRPLASASRATTFPRGTRCCRHGPRRKSASLVTFLRGWQHRAAFASDKRALDLHLSYIDAASPALLLSLAGPHAARAFAVLPTSAELMVPSPLFRVLLLRRLRLPLPVAPRTCACRGRLDPLLGDHRAACATSGVLASRALPLERAVARVSQEAGARVARNVRLADMSIDVPVSDDRRIEVVANWLSLWHGAQQAVDATIVSPVTRAGSRRTPRSSCRWRRRTQMPPDLPRARACSPLPLGGRRCVLLQNYCLAWAARQKLKFCDEEVAPAEWDSEPILCTPASLKKALSDGSAVEGNLIVTRDPNCVAEVQALCDAFAYEGELSVATVAEQDLLLPTVNVWWKTGKSPDNRPQRLKLRVTQISTLPGPDVKPPVSVTPQTPGPGEFRQGFLRKDRTDSPEAVISALATLAPCKVSCLTGGRWLQTQDKASKVLTAFLRVPQEVGEALAKVSGQKGLFCTVLDKNRGVFQICQRPSTEARQAVGLSPRRQNLGILNGAPDAFPNASRVRVWEVAEVPKNWGEDDVRGFLCDVKWHVDEVGTCVTVSLETVRKRPRPEHEPVQGPKKIWIDKKPTKEAPSSEGLKAAPVVEVPNVEVAPTQIDAAEDSEPDAASAQVTRARARPAPYPLTRPKEASLPKRAPAQRPDAAAEASSPDDMLLSFHLPDRYIQEDGRGGDCAFEGVARAIAHRRGLKPSSAELQREAATLRLLAVGHLGKHKQRFSTFWVAEDPAIDPTAVDEAQYWGGLTPPSTFDEYVKMMAKRDAYADGVSLQALCECLGPPLIVWHYQPQDSTWQRSVMAPFEQDGWAGTARKSPPAVTLVLRDAHYRSLLGPSDAEKKQDSQDAAVETCALKKHSATPTTVTRPSCFGGLPRFPVAEGEHSDVWWKCRLPGCQFSLGPFPQSKQEQNRMYKARRSHLKVTHGVEAEPLPKGGKCSLPDRLPKQRATFDARWKFVWKLQERELERLP